MASGATPGPSRWASGMFSARRCAWSATWTRQERNQNRSGSACSIWTAGKRERCSRRPRAPALKRWPGKRRWRSRMHGCIARRSRRRELDQELVIAAEIQRGLMPAAKYVGAGFEIVGSSLPCRAIGGDFFDHVELPSGDFGFALGDVAGKGPPAALLTVALQALFTAHAGRRRRSGRDADAPQPRADPTCRRQPVRHDGLLRPVGGTVFSPTPVPATIRRFSSRAAASAASNRVDLCWVCFRALSTRKKPSSSIRATSSSVFSDGVSEAVDVAGEEFGDDRIISCLQS